MNNSNYIAVNTSSTAQPATTGRFVIMFDAVMALIITVLCSLRVYKALGKPALTGIDDENITQVYAQNLAHGFGYVYTPNFEHVEGATSPLWVAIHYLLYKITAQPEPFILICSAALTALAIYWALGIARAVSASLALPRWALWIPILAIAAQPYYFHWTVVTMMDQGLWGTLVLGLVYVLVREVENPRVSVLGVLLCALSVLARPESMLLMPAMLAIAAVIVAINKSIGAAIRYVTPYIAAVVVTLAGLTAARLKYFGYPFPNTYYAKVSSNPKDNIVQGIHYIVGFLDSNILVVPCVLAAVLALLIGVQSLWSGVRSKAQLTAAHGIMLLVGGTIAVVIATLVLEGGDHFPGFRMMQPYVPLLAVALMFYVPLLGDWSKLSVSRTTGALWTGGIVIAVIVASYCAFAVWSKPLKEDFSLAVEGRRMGELLNKLGDEHLPDVGVLPAGGIAVTYHGRVADLLGLNWVEMAHASGRRTGVVGHSGFNMDVYWKHPPELMLPQLLTRTTKLNEKQTPGNFELEVLHGLMNQQQFREQYKPVLIQGDDARLFAFARASFVSRHEGDSRVEVLPWSRFRDAPAEAPVAAN